MFHLYEVRTGIEYDLKSVRRSNCTMLTLEHTVQETSTCAEETLCLHGRCKSVPPFIRWQPALVWSTTCKRAITGGASGSALMAIEGFVPVEAHDIAIGSGHEQREAD